MLKVVRASLPTTVELCQLRLNSSSPPLRHIKLCKASNTRVLSTAGQTSNMLPPPQSLLKSLDFPRKLLMGPGPSNCSPRVLAAGALPLLGHLHPEFCQIMDETKAGIQYAFQTTNKLTLAISGTGHAAMEAACCNLVEPGDVVMVATKGLWGERFADMADRHDAVVKSINKPMGQVFTLEDIEKGLKEHKPAVMFITHGESSGTTCQPLEGVGALCHKYNCILLVDSVAAMGGVPLLMDDWEIDVIYSGAQKVLSVPPGASPISFNERAWQKVANRKTKVRSFYMDMNWLGNYWGCDGAPARKYHHTGPISSIYQLREGLAQLAEEGLEACQARHKKCAELLHKGLQDLGLGFIVKDPSARLPTVTGVVVPAGVDWKMVTQYAMKNHKVEISGGLGELAGKIWRIGIMGYNAQPENIPRVLTALKEGIEFAKTNPGGKL